MTTNPPAIVKRHSRALRILTCLQSGPSFNATELARRLNVSRRTIYRDLNLIRDAGIEVTFDEEHSAYRLGREPMPAARLEPEDLTKLALTAHFSSLQALSPDFDVSVRESLARLLSPYPSSVRGPIQRIMNCCHVSQPTELSPSQSQALQQVLASIGRQCRVRLVLDDPERGAVVTRFATHRVQLGDHDWVLTGHSTAHRGRRSIPLSQVQTAEPTTERYVLPRGSRTRRAS